ncbi:MAG: hypothetical protein AAFR36_26155, partial [Bacteroidota bacterium]
MQTFTKCLSNATQLFSALLILGGLAFSVPAMGQPVAVSSGTSHNAPLAAGNCIGGLPSYDNTPGDDFGVISQEFSDFPTFDSESAEDFVAPGAPGETVGLCSVSAGGAITVPTIISANSVRLTIYADNSGLPGAEIYSEVIPGNLADPDMDGVVLLEPTTEVLLEGGTTYWASIVVIAPFGTFGQWFWEQINNGVGNNSALRNPGGGLGVGCPDWAERVATCGIGDVPELNLMVMFNSLCEFVDNEVSCIANVNVTLDDACSARITPSMVLAGADVDCATNITITVDGGNSDIISGCGDHTYEATVTDGNGNVTYTCWGNIFAEDKTDPTIECPDDTDEVVAEFNIQTTTGTIDATDPTIELADYSCFLSLFDPVAGPYGYDLLEISVSATDVYNIIVDGDVADQTFISVYAGDFNPDNPCENILGGTEGAWAPGLFFGAPAIFNFFNQNFRIPLILEPGQTYTIMVASNDLPNDYTVGVVADNGSTVSGAGFGAAQAVDLTVPLYCEDIDLIQFTTPQSWVVSAGGALDATATRALNGWTQSELN